MKKVLLLITTLLIFCPSVFSVKDTLKVKYPSYISINAAQGAVFQTSYFVSGEHRIPHYTSFSLKYAFESPGKSWKDYALKMPYMGIGVYNANFYRDNDFGRPVSIFLFQGAYLTSIYRRVSLNYEWNLGVSFNWKHYHPERNPMNTVIGTSVNVHVGGNLYLKWKISKKLDLDVGLGLNHFSNGASHYPNYGINAINIFTELSYHFNRENIIPAKNEFTAPEFEKHNVHEIMFLVSSRHAKLDTTGTNLPSIYAPRNFRVLGISYAFLRCPHFRYKFGPSIDLTYDESSGFRAWREIDPNNGLHIDHMKLGEFSERISLGISIKGEMKMNHYSFFANLGFNVIHGNKRDNRLYQVIGVKVNFTKNIFGTFGIKARNISRATYLFTNLGFTIDNNKSGKK